ncbi:MAG: rRNA maturation RNase YbeY [Lachnospiraceae bacterium]
MTINFENEFDEDLEELLGFPYQEVAREVIAKVLEREHCPYEAEVNLLFVGEEEIREINLEQREIDAPTDVLSFPMFPYEVPAAFEELSEVPEAENFSPESGELLLGDIVLCIPRVLAQAKEYGHSVKREYAFLLAHSTLHLVGYDHLSNVEAAGMEERQEAALTELGICRE